MVALFGIFVPWQKGLDFFDALILLPYSMLSLLFVSPIVIDGCYQAGKRVEPHRLLLGVVWGWCWGFGLVVAAVVTVNVTAVQGPLQLPPRPLLLSALVLSLLGCLNTGAISAWVSLLSETARGAKRTMRISFLMLICALLLIPHVLSSEGQEYLTLWLMPDRLARLTLWGAPVLALAGILLTIQALRKSESAHESQHHLPEYTGR